MEMKKQDAIKAIEKLSVGIDMTENDSNNGWWETEKGAEFGKEYLAKVIQIINLIEN